MGMKRTGLAVGGLLALAAPAAADEYRVRAKVGQCEYTSNVAKNENRTKCAAEAYFVNTTTSELFLCRAEVEGDQYVAPSVGELAPDTITCTRLGLPYTKSGSFDVAHADDTTRLERTFNRLTGFYSWKNGFWSFSQTTPEIKFCTHRLSEAAPDYRIRCSRNVDWKK